MDLITDSSYDLIKHQLKKTLNDTEKLKSKLLEIHSQKEEENLQRVRALKDSIKKATKRLIRLIRANEKRLMNEAINIEFTLNNNLNEFVADCEKSLLEAKIKEYKTLMNKNDLSELQLKKLCRDLFNFNSDMAFKIDKISKLV